MPRKNGSHITPDRNGSDFKRTAWSNSGKDDDKGSRTSTDWKASGGGWNKGGSHSTNQNASKGSSSRHK